MRLADTSFQFIIHNLKTCSPLLSYFVTIVVQSTFISLQRVVHCLSSGSCYKCKLSCCHELISASVLLNKIHVVEFNISLVYCVVLSNFHLHDSVPQLILKLKVLSYSQMHIPFCN